MRNLFKISLICFYLCVLMGCQSSKNITLLQNTGQEISIPAQELKYEVLIKKGDILSILITCKDLELTAPFNMPIVGNQLNGTQTTLSTNYGNIQGFLVEPDGCINYPVFGKIKTEGLSLIQVSNLIKDKLITTGAILDPIVNVRLTNFKIAVLGEVNRPGYFPIDGERITILDAISMAGDMTEFAKSAIVKVVRDENGKRTVTKVNLKDDSLLSSPYFFLQQNDIVYIEPNNMKSNTPYLTIWSIVISTLSLLANIGLYFR